MILIRFTSGMLAPGGVFFNLVNYSLRGTKQSTCSLSIVNCSRCGHQLQIRVIMRRDVHPRDRVAFDACYLLAVIRQAFLLT